MSNLILKTIQGTAQVDSQPAFKHGEAERQPGRETRFLQILLKIYDLHLKTSV